MSTITKQALAGAMKELLSRQPFSEIHVSDICQRCGLSRKSLYYHFEDKYELVNWVFYSELIVPLRESDCQDFWDILTRIADYLYLNRSFYYHAFHIRGDNSFGEYFSAQLQPYIHRYIAFQMEKSLYFSVAEKREAYAEFLADAYVFSMEKWILKYPQLTPERYVDLFRV